MKYTNVSVERTFNLGNYESTKVKFEVLLSDSDKPLEVTAELEMLCHQHYENQMQKKANTATTATPAPAKPAQTVTTTPQPTAQPPRVKTAAEMANENTVKRLQAAKADPNKCPKCGGRKKPEYELCYTCHEAERAQ